MLQVLTMAVRAAPWQPRMAFKDNILKASRKLKEIIIDRYV